MLIKVLEFWTWGTREYLFDKNINIKSSDKKLLTSTLQEHLNFLAIIINQDSFLKEYKVEKVEIHYLENILFEKV
ncbi:MAG: hypothetical protein ACRC7H_11470 [Plesiomonas shigelloides]